MLASTMQHSTHNHTPTPQPPPHPPPTTQADALDGPGQERHQEHTPNNGCLLRTQQRAEPPCFTQHGLCVPPSHTHHPHTNTRTDSCHRRGISERRPNNLQSQPGNLTTTVRLLRKEVIQPHLPVRLPCYDFVPIASPTFDNSLPQGVRPSASGVTNFRDVTGGVYKARERIHRSVADLRLLATPTSRGRVADPDPN